MGFFLKGWWLLDVLCCDLLYGSEFVVCGSRTSTTYCSASLCSTLNIQRFSRSCITKLPFCSRPKCFAFHKTFNEARTYQEKR